jgi:hypothetical protein
MTDTLQGPHGKAVRIPRESYAAAFPANLDTWIITAPIWHPLWSQYNLSVVSLADIPGQQDAIKHTPDATHELLVLALNPDHGPYGCETRPNDLEVLLPVNISEQFTTTDDHARELAELCVKAVLDGRLNPETGDAPTRIREEWRAAIAQTIGHDRDPHHGCAN